DYPGLGMIAISFAIAIAIAVYAFGETSGAHINPAVTVSLAATGRFPWGEVAPYLVAQLVGGFIGALLIVASFGSGIVDLAAAGNTTVAEDTSYIEAIVAEAVGTFLLLTAVMALAVDRRAAPGWAGLMIGLAVGGAILVIGPLTGGSLNPARTFGPLLATTLWGGDTNWGDFPVYIIGPLIGGAVAAFLYDYVARPGEVGAELGAPGEGREPAAEPPPRPRGREPPATLPGGGGERRSQTEEE
ncbi:MAG: MIP/aquaporin family protein, partial [Candidatus Limnocylindrales bacterium]